MKSKKIDIHELPEEAQKALAQFPEFQLKEFNDSGANGYVMIGYHKVLRKNVALKIYFHDDGDVDQEPALVAGINHKNVLKVYDARIVKKSCSYYMMPAADDGDLANFLNKYYISLSLSHKLLCQLLSGLSALHDPRIKLVHRDLKPENLLVNNDSLIIADFGSVRKIDDISGKAPASRHSILYRPPESFGEQAYFDFSSDIYQSGIVGYLLFGGKLSNDLLGHLSKKDIKSLKGVQKRGGDFEVSQFIDSCLERKIIKGTLLKWDTLPCYVPSSLVRILKRAVKPHGVRYGSVSDFLSDLSRIRNNLPEWICSKQGIKLENWKGCDYILCEEDDKIYVKKRKAGKSQFRKDNSIECGHLDMVFSCLKAKIALP